MELLYSYQIKALEKLHNGSILCGEVGSGKSRTAIAYFFVKVCNGSMPLNGKGSWGVPTAPRDLYIITTAKKRDDGDWVKELIPFGIGERVGINIKIDSWNNIKKYKNVVGAFFIFDEQRVKGTGPWVKAFYRIAYRNQWILLSATPGDKWTDYMPVFIANGFYTSKGDFERKHCIFARYTNFPKITGYYNEPLLLKHKAEILVKMKKVRSIEKVKKVVHVNFDKDKYDMIKKKHWNIFDNRPIDTPGEWCFLQRKVVNSDPSRLRAIKELIKVHKKAIIFYNYDFELELLRSLFTEMEYTYAEWNGHNHNPLPETNSWAYLVNYSSGAEGWNCITTDTIIFYSPSYSYSTMIQASGRTDRANTPYITLFYYELYSDSAIDRTIRQCLRDKKDFNEKEFFL